MRFLPLILLALAACVPDETLTAYATSNRDYVLVEVNDAPAPYRATIRFGSNGDISGNGPCNEYRTTTEDPYPWLKITPVISTKRACADLKAEAAYFAALTSMTMAEASGPVLYLTNDAQQSLLFRIP